MLKEKYKKYLMQFCEGKNPIDITCNKYSLPTYSDFLLDNYMTDMSVFEDYLYENSITAEEYTLNQESIDHVNDAKSPINLKRLTNPKKTIQYALVFYFGEDINGNLRPSALFEVIIDNLDKEQTVNLAYTVIKNYITRDIMKDFCESDYTKKLIKYIIDDRLYTPHLKSYDDIKQFTEEFLDSICTYAYSFMTYNKEQQEKLTKLISDCCEEWKKLKEPTLDKDHAEGVTVNISEYRNYIECTLKFGRITSGICSTDKDIITIDFNYDTYEIENIYGSYSFNYPSDEDRKSEQFDSLLKLLNKLNSKYKTFGPAIKYLNSLEN